MKIESIKSQKNIFEAVIDGIKYTLSAEIVFKYNINKNKILDASTFKKLLNENEELLCKEKLYKMVSKYLKTEKGYRDKLYSLGFSSNAIEKAIDILKGYGYIDDNEFCRRYIAAYKSKKGIFRIKQDLLRKGIDSKTVSEHLETFDTPEGAIPFLIEKFARNKEKNIDTKNKLYRHLISKGFVYDEVSKAVNDWYKNVE